jgi:5-methylcytosine-specific restriction endonuclease McrA
MARRRDAADHDAAPLPSPDSEDFAALRLGRAEQAIYRAFYEHQDTPLSMQELRALMGDAAMGNAEQLGRRRRNLHPYFTFERSGRATETRYRLTGRAARSESADLGISERDRAEVLRAGRCAMCGRTPNEDGVKLQVDHKTPQSWGGSSEVVNLQALCEECNRGKKNYFASIEDWGPHIKAASAYEDPRMRIGELLKRVHPDEVRSDVVEMVAQAQQYQEDWQKRLRELREIGWVIPSPRRKKDEEGRVRVYWRVESWEDWPADSTRDELNRRQRARKAPREEES